MILQSLKSRRFLLYQVRSANIGIITFAKNPARLTSKVVVARSFSVRFRSDTPGLPTPKKSFIANNSALSPIEFSNLRRGTRLLVLNVASPSMNPSSHWGVILKLVLGAASLTSAWIASRSVTNSIRPASVKCKPLCRISTALRHIL